MNGAFSAWDFVLVEGAFYEFLPCIITKHVTVLTQSALSAVFFTAKEFDHQSYGPGLFIEIF